MKKLFVGVIIGALMLASSALAGPQITGYSPGQSVEPGSAPALVGTNFSGTAANLTVGYVSTLQPGPNLVTSWVNSGTYPYETFTSAGTAITSAINTTGYGEGDSNQVSMTVGNRYTLTFNLTQNSGTIPRLYVSSIVGGAGTISLIITTPVAGLQSYVFTATSTTAYLNFNTGNNVATNFSVAGVSLTQVPLMVSGPSDTGTYAATAAPTPTSCGTSPTVVIGSNNLRGKFTIDATGTACTLTFATAFINAPSCVVSGAVASLATTTNSALQVTALPGTFSYICAPIGE